MNTPTNEELLSLCIEGDLTHESPQLIALSEQSEQLAERVTSTLSFAAILKEVPLTAPPKHVSRAAHKAMPKGESQWRVWLGKLWTPSAELTPAFRGAAAAPALYHAGPFEIDVMRTSSGTVVGELAPTEEAALPTSGTCTLFGIATTHTCELNEDGEFRFEDVESGPWRLVIDLESESLVVSELSL